MSRTVDLARLERERLSLLERRAKARAERRAVSEGVEETVALSRARGGRFEAPERRAGEREGAYRRLAGLDWLARKGRVSERQKALGEAYGGCYRLARAEAKFGSTLNIQPGATPASGTPLAAILVEGERRAQAQPPEQQHEDEREAEQEEAVAQQRGIGGGVHQAWGGWGRVMASNCAITRHGTSASVRGHLAEPAGGRLSPSS